MRLIDGDELLEKWNDLSERGRAEFDQVIMCQPTVPAILVDKVEKHPSIFDFDDDRPQCCIDHDKWFSTCDTCEFGQNMHQVEVKENVDGIK